jgi:hypothetical protein
MKEIIPLALAMAIFSATAYAGDRHIAFERNGAAYIAVATARVGLPGCA